MGHAVRVGARRNGQLAIRTASPSVRRFTPIDVDARAAHALQPTPQRLAARDDAAARYHSGVQRERPRRTRARAAQRKRRERQPADDDDDDNDDAGIPTSASADER